MRWLVTGGAGFIGCNTVRQLLANGHDVVVYDNLSRSGSSANLAWLQTLGRVEFVQGDVRDSDTFRATLAADRKTDVVLHLAGQVAVTTSLIDPRNDFEVNALGTFNVCEAVRVVSPETILLNASTNKVYGNLAGIETVQHATRYAFRDQQGVSEEQPVDYHSPYGCSKGVADAYVHDYARVFGLRSVNFRQSCIYGERQFGIEDQGWVAWFAIAAVLGKQLTIFGDGKQARDLLFVDDLARCYMAAVDNIETSAGQTYNVGGGPLNVMSLLELLDVLGTRLGKRITYDTADWRSGDQPVFVCDVSKAERQLGWKPTVSTSEGVDRLVAWTIENRGEIESALSRGHRD